MNRPAEALAQFELQRSKGHRVFPIKLADTTAVLEYIAALEATQPKPETVDPDQPELALEEPSA